MAKKQSGKAARHGARKHSRAQVSRESGANPARTLIARRAGSSRRGGQ
jgi:hypothetical protein